MTQTVLAILLAGGLIGPAGALSTSDIPSVASGAVDTKENRLARQMRARLASDPGAAGRLARRILRSKIGERLTRAEDTDKALSDIRSWINKNPDSAGYLAVGFAQDDARGSRSFERSLFERIDRYFELNPERHRGILGRLDRVATQSKTISRLKDLDDERGRELLKKFFDGKSGGGGRLGKRPGAPPKSKAPSSGPAAYAGEQLYDRINSANPTGYSPAVMAYQSAINSRRPPGAPKLIETGRLDYATLRHPYYGLRSDIDSLGRVLRAQRAQESARLLGKHAAYSRGELNLPSVQRTLAAEAAAKSLALDPAFARRAAALAGAESALKAFDREAALTKKRGAITPARLAALSRKRREAARFISLAAVEARVQRLKSWRGLITPELRREISAVPAAAGVRRRYLARGEKLEKALETAIAQGEVSLKLLRTPRNPAALKEAAGLMAATVKAAKSLPRELWLYQTAPGRLLAAHKPVSRLRAWAEALILRFLPGSDRARAIESRRKKEADARTAFTRIADK